VNIEKILKIVGEIAGVGGLALGIFLIIFKDIIGKVLSQKLTKEQIYKVIRLSMVLTTFVTCIGIGAYIISIVLVPATEPPSQEDVLIEGTVYDSNKKPIRWVEITFDPPGESTTTRTNGTYGKAMIFKKLNFPMTVLAYHDRYKTYEAVITIDENRKTFDINMEEYHDSP